MSSILKRCATALFLAAPLALAGCSDPVGNPDGGDKDPILCTEVTDCPLGWNCVGGLCQEEQTQPTTCESDEDCEDGKVCNLLLLQCEAETTPQPDCESDDDCTNGTCNLSTGKCQANNDGGGTACETKYDCNDGQICRNRMCINPPSSTCNTDADCPRGNICNFSRQCEPGCLPVTDGFSRDCAEPNICHPVKFECEPCSRTNRCPEGYSCLEGACQEATPCANDTECRLAFDGSICVGGVCGNCTNHVDCSKEPTYENERRICAADSLCRAATCFDDQCKEQLGRLGYCDTLSGSCATYQCLNDSDCTGGQRCNTTNNRCGTTPDDCNLADCETGCAAQGYECNPSTCRCVGGSGDGGEGEACFDASDCQPGLDCFLGVCSEPDPFFQLIICFIDPSACGCTQFGAPLWAGAGLFSLLVLRRWRRRRD